ncbi:MAG: hypothetical protein ACXWCZ_06735 [Flavisolibacter sp.]
MDVQGQKGAVLVIIFGTKNVDMMKALQPILFFMVRGTLLNLFIWYFAWPQKVGTYPVELGIEMGVQQKTE